MIELQLLGSTRLTKEDGTQVRSVLSQPKRLALLSYLAVTSPGGLQRRDKILALFWPDSDEKRARSSLSEALSRLRKSLGEGVIVRRGNDEVGIDPERVRCDVTLFDAAVYAGDYPAASKLYRGPLLDGFILDSSPEFDQWLESTRARLQRSAVDAVGRYADQLFVEGDPHALEWAERALQFEPLDSRSVSRVMRFMAEAGHQAAAINVYEQFAQQLDVELAMEPPDAVTQLVGMIREGDGAEPVGVAPEGRQPGVEFETGPAAVAVDVPREGRSRRSSPGRPTVVSAALLAAAVWGLGFLVGRSRSGSDLVPPWTSAIVLAQDHQLLSGGSAGFDVSPSGDVLVYAGGPAGEASRLWVRRRSDDQARPLAGTEGARRPAVSPDGRELVYLMGAPGRMRVVAVDGGTPVETQVSGRVSGLTWGLDGLIYYSDLNGRATGISRLNPKTGVTEVVTRGRPDLGEERHGWIDVLPDEAGIVFVIDRGTPESYQLAATRFDGTEIVELGRGLSPRFLTSGHLVFTGVDGSLMAASFNPRTFEMGSPISVGKRVGVSRIGTAQFALSKHGMLIHAAGVGRSEVRELTGESNWSEPLLVAEGLERFALSPDGSTLALQRVGHLGADRTIWLWGFQSPQLRQLTFIQWSQTPSWSPDGTHVVYSGRAASQSEPGARDLWSRPADASQAPSRIVDASRQVLAPSATADGRLLYVQQDEEDRGGDIFIVHPDPDSVGHPVLNSSADEQSPSLSTDGRWLLYASNEDGVMNVFIRPFPDVGTSRERVSMEEGSRPVWGTDDREVIYESSNSFYRVKVEEGRVIESPRLVAAPSSILDLVPRGGSYLGLLRGAGVGRLEMDQGFQRTVERLVPN